MTPIRPKDILSFQEIDNVVLLIKMNEGDTKRLSHYIRKPNGDWYWLDHMEAFCFRKNDNSSVLEKAYIIAKAKHGEGHLVLTGKDYLEVQDAILRPKR